MNKKELLQELSNKIVTGELSREEVIRHFNIVSAAPGAMPGATPNAEQHTFSVTKMLYALGAAIVVVGIVIFVHQVWDDIGSFGRVIITLGMGVLTAAIGSMLLKNKPQDNIGMVFHFIGGMLIPGGAVVTLNELNISATYYWPAAIIFIIIFAFYLLLNYVHKNAILTLFAIANGTASFYLVIQAIIGGPFYRHEDLYAYITMIVGISYLLLGYAFREGWNNKLIGALYFFGITGFLGAAFSRVFDSPEWQIFYFFIVIGGLILAVYIKNRTILVMSTLFLIAHISFITGKYFADSLGWPIVLVILGFIFIGLGYVSINLNKKYITG